MDKYKEMTLKIEAKLKETLRKEYSDGEGEWKVGTKCTPFFIGCLIAITMLYNELTDSEIDSLEMTYIFNRLMFKTTLEKMGVQEIRV